MFWVKEFIEILFSLSLFINAALFIPQAIRILKTKGAQNVSLITFAGLNLMQIPLILHGYIHGDYLLMWGVSLAFFTCGSVTFLTILYRNK